MTGAGEISTPQQLAAIIDHTYLQASGDESAVRRLCDEALRFGFAAVAVNPVQVQRCAALLEGSKTKVCGVAGFPLGQNTTAIKIAESRECIAFGAHELDLVINQSWAKAGELDPLRRELGEFASLCRDSGVLSKIILECCNLTDDQKIAVCSIARECGCDFVKTSTGFGAHGATVHDVRLMRKTVGPDMGVKASGGVRTLSAALELVQAGATRLGTSNGVAIVEEWGRGRRPENNDGMGY